MKAVQHLMKQVDQATGYLDVFQSQVVDQQNDTLDYRIMLMYDPIILAIRMAISDLAKMRIEVDHRECDRR